MEECEAWGWESPAQVGEIMIGRGRKDWIPKCPMSDARLLWYIPQGISAAISNLWARDADGYEVIVLVISRALPLVISVCRQFAPERN